MRVGFYLQREVISVERQANMYALSAAKAMANEDKQGQMYFMEKAVSTLANNRFLLDAGLLQVLPFLVSQYFTNNFMHSIISKLQECSDTLEFTNIERSEVNLALSIWHYRTAKDNAAQHANAYVHKIIPTSLQFTCQSIQQYTLYLVQVHLLQFVVRDVASKDALVSHDWGRVQSMGAALLESLQQLGDEYSNVIVNPKIKKGSTLLSKLQVVRQRQCMHILLLMWWLGDRLYDQSKQSTQYTQRLKQALSSSLSRDNSLRIYLQQHQLNDLRQDFISSQRLAKVPIEQELLSLLQTLQLQYIRAQDITFNDQGVGTLAFVPKIASHSIQRYDSASVNMDSSRVQSNALRQCVVLWVSSLDEVYLFVNKFSKCSQTPHIPCLYGVTQQISEEGDQVQWGLVFEEPQGINLHCFLYRRKKYVDMMSSLRILKSISRALMYLHKENIAHGALAMHNIIVTKQGCVKLKCTQQQIQGIDDHLEIGKHLSVQRDLLDFGKIMFEVLYGQNQDYHILQDNQNWITKQLPWKLLRTLKAYFISKNYQPNVGDLSQMLKEVQMAYAELESLQFKCGGNDNIRIPNIIDAVPSAILPHLSLLDEITKIDKDPENRIEYQQLVARILQRWQDMPDYQMQSILNELKKMLSMVEDYD